jgi:hypothetical protein
VGRICQRRWLFERRREILRAIWRIAYGDGKSDTPVKSNGDSDSHIQRNTNSYSYVKRNTNCYSHADFHRDTNCNRD